MPTAPKHDTVACPRCHARFECKANTPGQCQCRHIALNLNETQYISEQFTDCLCINCLHALQAEYNEGI